MAKRGIRVMLWVVIVVAAALTAYFFWVDESAVRRDTTTARAFADVAHAAGRAVMDVRSAQQGYVAAGQGDDFWASKVGASLTAARRALDAMRSASSPAAQEAVRSAFSILEDFEQMDRRAREYVRSAQLLLASDIIFSDGLEMTESAWAEVQRAGAAEQQAIDAAARAARQRQWITLATGGGAVAFVALLLVPVPRAAAEANAEPMPAVAAVPAADEDLDLRTRSIDADEMRWAPPPHGVPPPAPIPPAPPDVDVPALARLCTELARVTDTRAVPPILERAAGILDAAGIVLWIADPDGRELTPIVAHGYSPQLVMRLGTIPRDAENVTAAAFRTGLVQTVKADAVSNGAIAAPLVTSAGSVGVMAAEVRDGGEQREGRLAAATIVAAQLATLVGPPVTRKAEAAGSQA